MEQTRRNGRLIFGLIVMLLTGYIILRPVPVRAENGTIYACTIHPCYRHPVSGVIEDSGGEAAYATGQGMVEGCVSTAGMLEVTDSGKKYLTIRLSLVDYTSDHAFQVQNRGDDQWSDPAIGITGEGSDKNGTTWDITMEVPSEDCVVRGTMMVTPMGRSVIFYLYPDSFTEGGADGANGMKAAMVTGSSGTASDGAGATDSGAAAGDAGATDSGAAAGDAGTTDSSAAAGDAGAAEGGTSAGGSGAADSGTASDEAGTTENSAATGAAQESGSNPGGVTAGAVDKNAGLSLSTAEQADTEDADSSPVADIQTGTGSEGTRTVGETIFINVVSGVLIGGILMGLGALCWCFIRKRKGSGLADPDEYDDLYKESPPDHR